MPNLSYLARIPSLSSSDFIFFFVLAIFCTSSFTDWPSHLFYLRNSAWMPIVVARGYVCDSLFLPLLFFWFSVLLVSPFQSLFLSLC